MDQRQRQNDPEEMLRASMDGLQAMLWTALPGIIQSYDPANNTCSVQLAIMGQTQDQKTGVWTDVPITILTLCPVVFPSGGGFFLTFPLKNGDECLVVFSKSTIDAWWQNSGVQPMGSYRVHDLSDGFVIPGPRSVPQVPGDIDPNKVQLRNEAGDCFIEMDGTKLVTITAPGGINLNGVTIDSSGNINCPATVTATTDVIGGGKHLKTHTHDVVSVQPGSSTIATTAPL